MEEEFTRKVFLYPSKELFIYIDSPGGSGFSLARMIGVMGARRDIKYTCVARQASSAAFMFFQFCHNRYMLPDGLLMSHDASVLMFGEITRIKRSLAAIEGVLRPIDTAIAARLGMTYEEYKHEIVQEWWMNVFQALHHKAVDSIIFDVTCSPKLVKKVVSRITTQCSLFGGCKTISRLYSACPLLTRPIVKVKKKWGK